MSTSCFLALIALIALSRAGEANRYDESLFNLLRNLDDKSSGVVAPEMQTALSTRSSAGRLFCLLWLGS